MVDLDGKVCLITGAGRGIGAETARMMAQAGAYVVVSDICERSAANVSHQIEDEGGRTIYFNLNVSKPDEWKAAVDKIVNTFKKLDVLVNNAGVLLAKDIEDVSLEEWNHMVAVNMTSVFLGTKICAPALRMAGSVSKSGSSIIRTANANTSARPR